MDKDVFDLLEKLDNHGYKSYIVGGCLRDILLGIRPNDFDITTNARPSQVKEVFREYKIFDYGIKYGTITVEYRDRLYEITTFRSEGTYSDNRRPDRVLFLDSIDEDLARRDFTINAMAMDKSYNIYDPFNGIRDLKNKIIRACGDANKRIEEDALRILRAIRFATRFKFYLDEELFDAISLNRNLLKNIARERIFSEICKIITYDNPSYGFLLMEETGILDILFPSLRKTVGFDQKTPWHDRNLFDHLLCVMDNVPNDLSLRFAAIFHDIAKPLTLKIDGDGTGHFLGHDALGATMAEDILKYYKAPKALIEKVSILIKEHMKVQEVMTDKALRRQIKRVGRENILDLYELLYADCVCTRYDQDGSFILNRKKRIEELLDEKEMKKEKFLEINGYDLIELGFHGKIIGQILKYAENLVLSDTSLNKKEILLEKIKNNFISGDRNG